MPDPANPQAFNRYSYVLNNPLRYIDPSGLDYVVVGEIGSRPLEEWRVDSWSGGIRSTYDVGDDEMVMYLPTLTGNTQQGSEQNQFEALSSILSQRLTEPDRPLTDIKLVGFEIDGALIDGVVHLHEPEKLPFGTIGASLYPKGIHVRTDLIKTGSKARLTATLWEEIFHYSEQSQDP